jgi:uridylate kinase
VLRLVLKLSGRIVSPDRPELIKAYAKAIRELLGKGYDVRAVVVGGGGVARAFVEAGRLLNLNRSQLDILGIEAARLNARLLAYALSDLAYPEPPRSLQEAIEAAASGRIVVAGGFQPGQSTAAVAALLAEALGADLLLLATRVDGVYDRDPERSVDAKLIPRLSYDELQKVMEQSLEPGRYELLDPLAIAILKRSRIPARVFNGLNPLNLLKAVRGEVGSLIEPG